jgi:small ligand-binding sensory domain FIST
MNRALVLFAILPGLAACNVRSHNPARSDGNVAINADESGHVSFNLPFMNGQLKLPEGVMRNSQFDMDGVKMMPGATITGLNVDSANRDSTVKIAFKAPASPDDVRAYFAHQFKQKGVEVASAGDAISGKSKDGDPFVIRVLPAAQGSQGTIDIQSKD